jgi:hypothetical protein
VVRVAQAETILADKAAFFPEGMIRWLNAIRRRRKPETTEAMIKNVMSAEKNSLTSWKKRFANAWTGGAVDWSMSIDNPNTDGRMMLRISNRQT